MKLLALADRLIHADGRVDVFEYALARLLAKHIDDALHPSHSRGAGKSITRNACRRGR
jgi:hypothetical protein